MCIAAKSRVKTSARDERVELFLNCLLPMPVGNVLMFQTVGTSSGQHAEQVTAVNLAASPCARQCWGGRYVAAGEGVCTAEETTAE
jgi:hypothetical protein